MFTVILGDGSVIIIKNNYGNDVAVIKITMSSEKLDRWKPILDRL